MFYRLFGVTFAVSCLYLLFLAKMHISRYSAALSVASLGAVSAQCNDPASVDLSWHAPNSSVINNLTAVVNGTGIYGFIFSSSATPSGVPYSTYNWCNMPHVRAQEYPPAPNEYKLEYVELVRQKRASPALVVLTFDQIHRHHKRTPYASNTFPHETYPWYCDDEALFYYGVPYPDGTSADIGWHVYTSPSNPFAPGGFNGTCQFPQITGSGLNDSRQHGKDLYGVYHDLLKFLPSKFDATKVTYRVTNNVITSQVAGQIVEGMFPATTNQQFPVSIQPASIDSLEPTYTCSAATALYANYGVGSTNANWTLHLHQSASLFATLDAISGVNATDPGWHQWFDHYFDNFSARQCHAKPLPCSAKNSSQCVTQEEADAVYRRGQYEYSYIWRDAPQSLAESTSSYGVWVAELASNLRAAMSRTNGIIYRHNVAHDGSVSRLLSILQLDVMVWPGMGSEVVFELYSKEGCWYVRVLWGGQILRSSNPSLGYMRMVPAATLLAYFDGLVGAQASKIPELCSVS
jgi:2-phosphoxylose phosphatase